MSLQNAQIPHNAPSPFPLSPQNTETARKKGKKTVVKRPVSVVTEYGPTDFISEKLEVHDGAQSKHFGPRWHRQKSKIHHSTYVPNWWILWCKNKSPHEISTRDHDGWIRIYSESGNMIFGTRK